MSMSNSREQLNQLLRSLVDEDLEEVLSFVKVLLSEPDELTEKEWREVKRGEEEIRRGEWVRWEDLKQGGIAIV